MRQRRGRQRGAPRHGDRRPGAAHLHSSSWEPQAAATRLPPIARADTQSSAGMRAEGGWKEGPGFRAATMARGRTRLWHTGGAAEHSLPTRMQQLGACQGGAAPHTDGAVPGAAAAQEAPWVVCSGSRYCETAQRRRGAAGAVPRPQRDWAERQRGGRHGSWRPCPPDQRLRRQQQAGDGSGVPRQHRAVAVQAEQSPPR